MILVLVVTGLALLGMVTGHETGKADTHEAVTADVSGDDDKRVEDKELVSGKFENRTLTLYWLDLTNDTAHLDEEEECIYSGHFEKDLAGKVLVTGCSDDEVSVQIQSTTRIGTRIFNLKNGTIEYVTFSKEELDAEYDYDYHEYHDHADEFPVSPEGNGRLKRNSEDDYYYYDDEPEPNPNFEENFPDLSESEVEDIFYPSTLILHLNVYLDRAWYDSFGRSGAEREARQVLRQVQDLYQDQSLETKLDIQFGDRIYRSSAPVLQADRKGLKTLDQNLKAPYKLGAGYVVTHLHLTADPPGKRSPKIGKAQINSVCDRNPKAIAKFKNDNLRTAMTVAHELGHVLGMEHDFKNTERRQKCQSNKRAGGTVMNYGSSRLGWSSCSNQDFKATYARVLVANDKFCLENPVKPVCSCNGKTDLAGGECRTSSAGGPWCYVDSNSACTDKKMFGSGFISNSACSGSACAPDQWQCKGSGKCIRQDQRCDGIRRHCSDGSDEADCTFDFAYYDDYFGF